MPKILLIMLLSFCLTGCMSPKLCGIDERPVNNQMLNPKHIEYFNNKPIHYKEEMYSTIFPIGHSRQQLETKEAGYRFVSYASLLGGLLAEGGFTTNFDPSGKRNTEEFHSAYFNLLAGLLFDWRVSADGSDLSGSNTKTYLVKSFGVSQECGGSKYYTIFWVPIKVSGNSEKSDQ